MMKTTEFKLLTIIIDEALRHIVEEEIAALGAKGYTLSQVEGKGNSGERSDHWTGMNVKIETIVSNDVLDKILTHLQSRYFNHYPVITYFHDVNVIRSTHFI